MLERLIALAERMGEVAGLVTMFDDSRPLAPGVDRLRSRGLVRGSWVSRLPGGPGRLRRWLLPLYPRAVEHLGRVVASIHAREPIDLVISVSAAAIKGLAPPPGVPHLCYCNGPARYMWSRAEDYRGGLRGAGLRLMGERFRRWDLRTAANVTTFLGNSTHIAAEVKRCYGREAAIAFPPVRTGYFTVDASVRRAGFWLYAGAIEPYKRVDLALAAAAHAGVRLVVAGEGSMLAALRGGGGGGPEARRGAEFLGRVSDERLRELYRSASVLLFPQVEDFGIVAVEAQACGLPVVARRAGGAMDTVVDGVTGVLVEDPTPAAIADAARACAALDPMDCRRNAERFGEAAFDATMERHIAEALGGR